MSVTRPRILHPILSKHKDFFLKHDLDIDQLSDDYKSMEKVISILKKTGNEIPTELLETLSIIHDFSDETSHDRLIEQAEKQGKPFSSHEGNISPTDFAILAYCENPHLMYLCRESAVDKKIKNYHEFQSQEKRHLNYEHARKSLTNLEKMLAFWFESKHRGAACSIYLFYDEHKIEFRIAHGRLIRTDVSVDHSIEGSPIAYRPLTIDSVIFDNLTSILKVNAYTSPEKELYRKVFGGVLFGDEDFFKANEIYTLEPIRQGKSAFRLVPGIEEVFLREVSLRFDDEQNSKVQYSADDLFESMEHSRRIDISEGHIVRAVFHIKFSSGGKARKLEIRIPNIASYDRERDGEVTEKFIRQNGLIRADFDGQGAEQFL